MDREELLRKLESLAQLDTDAVHVYSEALKGTEDHDVYEMFERFQGEHRYHAEQLTQAVVRLGGKEPELKVDMMGHLADWVTTLRSMRGTKGALHAIQTAEHYHTRHYGEAVSWDVDDVETATLLRRFYDDEKRHLAFVEERLAKPTADVGGLQ